MRRAILLSVLMIAGMVFCAEFATAQEHGQFGVFADYLRLSQTHTNFGGLGGRLAVNPSRYFGLEAEVAYDFTQAFTEGFTNPSNGSVSLANSNIRVLHGIFGPTLSTGHGAVRVFVTAKGGFINFRFDPRPATFGTFTSSVTGLRASDVSGVFDPGGGIEGHLGPFGLRLDLGDEMYFNNGTHDNLRVTFGPIIRF